MGGFDLYLPFWIIQLSFCQTKVPFHWSKQPFFKNNLYINNFLIFHLFRLKYCYHIFCAKLGICCEIVDCENKLNRNAYNAVRRRLLSNIWLQIKTFTNQTFTFSVDCISSVFKKNIYVNKAILLIFDWSKDASNSISFYYFLNKYLISPPNSYRQSAIAEGFAEANSVFIVIISAKILPRWLFPWKMYIQITSFNTYFLTKLSLTNKKYHLHVLEKCLYVLQEVKSIIYFRQFIHPPSLMFLNSFFHLIFFRSRKDATESRIHAQMFS